MDYKEMDKLNAFIFLGLIALFFTQKSHAVDSIPADYRAMTGVCFDKTNNLVGQNTSAYGCQMLLRDVYSITLNRTLFKGGTDEEWAMIHKGVYGTNYGLWYKYGDDGFFCDNPQYPTLNGEVCEIALTVCPDGYYSDSSGCDRPTPTMPEEITICLNGSTNPPDWPACAEGLDDEFVRGVEGYANSAQADADLALLHESQFQAFEYDIEQDAQSTLKDASRTEALKNIAENNVSLLETSALNHPDIQTVADSVTKAQEYADITTEKASSALASATDASVLSIQANQDLLDAIESGNQVAINNAKAKKAYADLYTATSRSQADALKLEAENASISAKSSLDELTSALNNISNSALQSYQHALDSANSALASANALIASNKLLQGAEDAIGNGEVCVGGECEPIPSDPEEEEETALKEGNYIYEQKYPDGFDGVLTDRISEFKGGKFYGSLQNFIVTISPGGVPPTDVCTGMFGCHNLNLPSFIWDFIKTMMIISASFACRGIIFGG